MKKLAILVQEEASMFGSLKLGLVAGFLVCGSPQVQGQVYPVPIRGGDILPPFGDVPAAFLTQFSPGVGATFDGLNAEPHGITNFRGIVAMGYTSGTATDNAGHVYNIGTDIRVYQGDYVGVKASGGGGGSVSAPAHGTFVEI
jgi:hypothetical protein